MASTARACEALTRKGAACQAPALPGSQWCLHHDPARAVDQLGARSAGGRARHGRTLGERDDAGEHTSVKTTADVVQLLERTINDALRLENSLNRARTVGYLALAALKAHEMNELADRVAALEMALKARDK
jgi:hypothetical protein